MPSISGSTHRSREEVLNVTLAGCLAARGVAADPEVIIRGRRMPDVIVVFRGLRCVIEGKISDVSNAHGLVAEDARRRVESGIAHFAIGAVYPEHLRTIPFAALAQHLNETDLDFFVHTENGAGDWRSGGIDALLAELKRSHETVVRDDVVVRSVDKLSFGMAAFSDYAFSYPAVCDRLIGVLGIGQAEENDAPDPD